MPRCGATFDENIVPPWTRGTSGEFGEGNTNPPRRSATAVAARHQSDGGDFHGSFSCRAERRHVR
jgi:hypothetical protein